MSLTNTFEDAVSQCAHNVPTVGIPCGVVTVCCIVWDLQRVSQRYCWLTVFMSLTVTYS